MNNYHLIPINDTDVDQYRNIPVGQLSSRSTNLYSDNSQSEKSFGSNSSEEWDIEKGEISPNFPETRRDQKKKKLKSRRSRKLASHFLQKSIADSSLTPSDKQEKLGESSDSETKDSDAEKPKDAEELKELKELKEAKDSEKLEEAKESKETKDSDKLEISKESKEAKSSESSEDIKVFSPEIQYKYSHQERSTPKLRRRNLKKSKTSKDTIREPSELIKVNVQKLRGGSIMDLRQIYNHAQLVHATARKDHESDSDSEADLDNAVRQLSEDDNNWIQGCGCQLNIDSAVKISQILIGLTILVFCIYKLVTSKDNNDQQTYSSLLSVIVGFFLPGRGGDS